MRNIIEMVVLFIFILVILFIPSYFLNKELPILLLQENQNLALAIGSLTSAWAAIVITIITIIAAYVAYKTSSEQRLHNKLTVRPMPEITIEHSDFSLCIKLVNHGFGPLLVKSFTSINIGSGRSGKSLVECVDLNGGSWTHSCGGVDGRVILPGKEILLVELIMVQGDTMFSRTLEYAREHLSNVKISVSYSDVYDSQFPVYEKRILLLDNSKYLE